MDFLITEQQRKLRDIARTFAYQEVRPRARELDRETDPRATFPLDLVRRASELGLRTIKIPERYGGAEASCLTEVIVLEELCVGDIGFGMLLNHAWREGYLLATCTNDEQRDRFLHDYLRDDTYLTSLGITEPHSGSDFGFGYAQTTEAGPQTRAVLEGDEWVINGSKRFITNGNVAKLIILTVRTGPSVPWPRGISLLLVPTDAPGLRVGRVEDKLGIRTNQNAELIFESCRVPSSNLLGEVNGALAVMRRFLPGSKAREDHG